MNILFTSSGRRGYLLDYFRTALNGAGKIHAANSSEFAPSFLHADATIITPLIHSPGYINFLQNYCEKNDIQLIIPLFDIDIPILARAKPLFDAKNIVVLVPTVEVADICNDKFRTYLYLQSHGIDTPRTYCQIADVRIALINNEITFPIVIKPRWGMGSIGLEIAENEAELDVFYKKVKRQIYSSYLKFESEVDKDHSIVFQEMIHGKEYGLDIVNNLNGQYVATFAKKKLAMRSGETDIAVTVDEIDLIKLGEKLGNLLGHIGNLDADVFKQGDKLKVLELNARFGGGYPFSHVAGADVPRAILSWLNGHSVNPEWLHVANGIIGSKDILPRSHASAWERIPPLP